MKIKICGIKTAEAARAVEKFGADYIGCIFYAKSKRYIAPEIAAEILRPLKIKKVGVFVNESSEIVNAIAEKVGLDYVQLHGSETAEYAKKICRPIIKAYRYGDGFSTDAANNFPCEFILVDSFVKGTAGGTGKSFDWLISAREINKITKPVFIAGGISIENFAEAAKIFNPYALDISGSLEIDGVKSATKIESFLCEFKNFYSAGSSNPKIQVAANPAT